MATGDIVEKFEGYYDVSVVLTLNKNIPSIAMELDTYERGVLTEHTYFTRDEAIALAEAILRELQ